MAVVVVVAVEVSVVVDCRRRSSSSSSGSGSGSRSRRRRRRSSTSNGAGGRGSQWRWGNKECDIGLAPRSSSQGSQQVCYIGTAPSSSKIETWAAHNRYAARLEWLLMLLPLLNFALTWLTNGKLPRNGLFLLQVFHAGGSRKVCVFFLL